MISGRITCVYKESVRSTPDFVNYGRYCGRVLITPPLTKQKRTSNLKLSYKQHIHFVTREIFTVIIITVKPGYLNPKR